MERHIAFCCDDNYLIPACVMLESLMKKMKTFNLLHTLLQMIYLKNQSIN